MVQQLWYPRELREKFGLEGQRFIQALIDKIQSIEGGSSLSTWLQAVNALTLATDKGIYATGAGTADTFDLTSFARTLLDDANAATARGTLGLGALATGADGSDVPVSGFSGTLASNTDVQAALDTIDSLAIGGQVREAVATADGTTEYLQVSMTSTPSTVARLRFVAKNIIPEIDNDTLFLTFILDDDSELTSPVYSREGFNKTNGSGLTAVSASGQSNRPYGTVGNQANEYINIYLDLFSSNGSQTVKFFREIETQTSAALAGLTIINNVVGVQTSSSIKGVRLDTDNAGDMINSGTLEVWVQT